MTHWKTLLFCALVLAIAAGAVPAGAQDATETVPTEAAAVGNEDVPSATYVNWYSALTSPITGHVAQPTDTYDVYAAYLEQGEYYSFQLTILGAGDLDLYLYGPSATSVADLAKVVKSSTTDLPNETVSGSAASEGYHYVVVKAASGESDYELRGDIRSTNDNIPGIPLQRMPEVRHLDSFSDWDDVYYFWLNTGDMLTAQLTIGASSPGFSPQLLLFGPGATNVRTPGAEILSSQQLTFPKTIAYTAPKAGLYYLDVHQTPLSAERVAGSAVLSWSVETPVYRFYNSKSGTHFYTPSVEEKNKVIAVWSSVFTYEGVAYNAQPLRNAQPLFRFYNVRSGSHFYTASATERDKVRATWPHIFTYEGETYRVSLSGPASAAVYRFYNRANGSHFFTASATERDIVIARWSNVYTYEGVAFYYHPW